MGEKSLDKLLGILKVVELVHFDLFVIISDVGIFGHFGEVLDEVEELAVVLVVVEVDDGDAVVNLSKSWNLEGEGVGGVVDDEQVGEGAVDDSKVLHVEALFRLDAGVAVESMLDELPRGI